MFAVMNILVIIVLSGWCWYEVAHLVLNYVCPALASFCALRCGSIICKSFRLIHNSSSNIVSTTDTDKLDPAESKED